MNTVRFADITLRESAHKAQGGLSFREKIEIAKLLDKLNMSVIEVAPIENERVDSLLIKSITSSVKSSIISVPTGIGEGSVSAAWEAVKTAAMPRLRVSIPASPVQMEYTLGKKPEAVSKIIEETVAAAVAKCKDVEFVAEDATRAEKDFLYSIIASAIKNGATTVTVCDSVGTMMPDEIEAFINDVRDNVPEIKNVVMGVECSNSTGMAVACAASAIKCGALEIKTAVCSDTALSLQDIMQFVRTRGESFDAQCFIKATEIGRITSQISRIVKTRRSKTSAFDSVVQEYDNTTMLSIHDDITAVQTAVLKLGYDISSEDMTKVYEAFGRIAIKKDVSMKELDAIVATAALQVPPTYSVESYVINSGNVINATANIKLKRGEDVIQGVCVGDGPIDASFLAIEQIAGSHFELDDFQITAVTEGHEATGEAIVRLRSNGKLYSGRGISTDIIGASIRAYVSALNKIVYEEA